MTRSLWLLLALTTLGLLLSACRTPPPPSASGTTTPGGASAPGVVSRREAGTGDLADKVIIDPNCSDFANEQNQIICITNKSGSAVDLGDWLVRNALGRTYYFPAGTSIADGQSLKLHTGAGANDAQNLYWNYEFKPVFDRKEQVTLVSKDNIDISKITTP